MKTFRVYKMRVTHADTGEVKLLEVGVHSVANAQVRSIRLLGDDAPAWVCGYPGIEYVSTRPARTLAEKTMAVLL